MAAACRSRTGGLTDPATRLSRIAVVVVKARRRVVTGQVVRIRRARRAGCYPEFGVSVRVDEVDAVEVARLAVEGPVEDAAREVVAAVLARRIGGFLRVRLA